MRDAAGERRADAGVDVEVAIVVEVARVACVEPAAGEEALPVRRAVALVVGDDRRPAYADVAGRAGGEFVPAVVEDGELWAAGDAARVGGERSWSTGDEVIGMHSVMP